MFVAKARHTLTVLPAFLSWILIMSLCASIFAIGELLSFLDLGLVLVCKNKGNQTYRASTNQFPLGSEGTLQSTCIHFKCSRKGSIAAVTLYPQSQHRSITFLQFSLWELNCRAWNRFPVPNLKSQICCSLTRGILCLTRIMSKPSLLISPGLCEAIKQKIWMASFIFLILKFVN